MNSLHLAGSVLHKRLSSSILATKTRQLTRAATRSGHVTTQVTKSDADWGNNMQNLAQFSTVEDFWKVYNNIPKPSQVSFPLPSSHPPCAALLADWTQQSASSILMVLLHASQEALSFVSNDMAMLVLRLEAAVGRREPDED